ncbi:MAG: class I SAM-dependent methyltransferase [Anaerolineales bacterium]|nr:class I SAM-dependent methyltransferase [Anaerolineales bacterium]MCB9127112.1 class I SAM-dependent methyltransferase [Ardenticatenales bacterium]
MPLDFAFNERVAQDYAKQRAHPPWVSAQIGRAVVARLGRGARLLELGVGTGRIARPIAAAGGRVVGIDLSQEMLREVPPTADAPIMLLRGDIQSLPVKSSSMAGVMAVHVLHLIPDWRLALSEIVRVLRPGGLFIQGRDQTDPDSIAGQLRHQLRIAVMALLPDAQPPAARASIPQALAAMGGTAQAEQVVACWLESSSPAAILQGMMSRADAETWALDDGLLQAAVGRVHEWATAQWGDLARAQPVERRFLLNVTQF